MSTVSTVTMKLSSILFVLSASPACSLTGYQFEDNKSDKRFVAENGEMSYELPSIPSYIAVCFSLYVTFNRYSSVVPIMDFRTSYEMDKMEFLYGDCRLIANLNNDYKT